DRGKVLDEREDHFGDWPPSFKFACDRYAVAFLRIRFSVSSSLIRFSIAACSRRPSASTAGLIPRCSSWASRTHACSADFEIPRSAHTCFCGSPDSTSSTAVFLNSSVYFVGMVAILPARKRSRSQPNLQQAQSFFSLLQKNVLNRRSWPTREELRIAIVTWIERTYHRRRRQVRLGRLTPIEFETIMNNDLALAAGPELSPIPAPDPGGPPWSSWQDWR